MYVPVCIGIGGGSSTTVQPQQDPKQCQRNWPRSLCRSTGAERTQGCFQKWHTRMHVHTKCSLPGKQQSTGWKNMVTDALKLRTLRACRGIEQLKDRRTTGGKDHNLSGGPNLMGKRSQRGACALERQWQKKYITHSGWKFDFVWLWPNRLCKWLGQHWMHLK